MLDSGGCNGTPGTYSYWACNPVSHEIHAKTRKGNKKI